MKPTHAPLLLLAALWPTQTAAQGVDSHALVQALQRGADRIPILSEPGGLVAPPGGDFLYVAAEDELGLGIFARDTADGRLRYLGNHPVTVYFGDGLRRVHFDTLALRPDGQHLYASGFLAAGPDDSGRLSVSQAVHDDLTLTTIGVSPDGRHVSAKRSWSWPPCPAELCCRRCSRRPAPLNPR